MSVVHLKRDKKLENHSVSEPSRTMRCPLLICCNMDAFLNTASVMRAQGGCKMYAEPSITAHTMTLLSYKLYVFLQFLDEKHDKVKKREAAEVGNHFK